MAVGFANGPPITGVVMGMKVAPAPRMPSAMFTLEGYTESSNNIASGGHQNTYGGGDGDVFLVKFQGTVPCAVPGNLTTANVSDTGADLGWTETGSATQWEIEYNTAGFVRGSGSKVVTSANPHTLSGLNSNTTYDFYVRSICGAGDTSLWSDVYAFTTLEATGIAQYVSEQGLYKVFARRHGIVVESSHQNNIKQVLVMDASGREVLQYRGTSENRVELSTTGLARGIYIVRVQDMNGEIYTEKVSVMSH